MAGKIKCHMAKIGAITLQGASGASYTFDIYPFDERFAQVGAVYLVTHQYKKPDGTIWHDFIYIGQTGNLPERFSGHHKLNCFQRNSANCICVHWDASERSRLAKEADLLRDRTLPCNELG